MSAPVDERLRLDWRPFRFQLPAAMVTAHGALAERRGWLLRLSRDDGAVGWGEAAPWPASAMRVQPEGLGQAASVQRISQSQLAVLEAVIARLGPVLWRQELEVALPALPACLGFALGLALAELDGLGAPAVVDQGREPAAAGEAWDRVDGAGRRGDRASGDRESTESGTGVHGSAERDSRPRGPGSDEGGPGGRRLRDAGCVPPGSSAVNGIPLIDWPPAGRDPGSNPSGRSQPARPDHGSREAGNTPAECPAPGSGDSIGAVAPWRGPWRVAPASAWLLPAGEAALAALETVLERAEQRQGREGAAGSPGRPRTAGAEAAGGEAPGAIGGVALAAAAAVDSVVVGAAADAGAPPAAAWCRAPQTSGPLTFKWKVAAGADPEERAVLEQLLARLPHGSRLRLDANGGWDRATAQAWAERLVSDSRLEWLEQPLAPADQQGLEALATVVPVALDESLRLDPGLCSRWSGWQVRRPSLEGDPRPLLRALLAGMPQLMLSTALETGIGGRFLAHLAALQQDGPTPTAPGLAPGWRPAGALFDSDPALVWAAAGGR